MAKAELGTKRQCQSCGAKFYDLSKSPILCPKCSTVFVAPKASSVPIKPEPEEEDEAVAAPAAEFVPLEEAEPADEAKDIPDVETDEEAATTEGDDTFLEPEEESEDDVSGLIDGEIEEEEEQ